MASIPWSREFDSSFAFLREGYCFVSRRCDELGSDLFATRLMLSPVICMRGAEAAERFYSGGRFTRNGAMPRTVKKLLQDDGSVQTLDGEAHRTRKAMFMKMAAPEELERLVAIFREEWHRALPRWQRLGRFSFYDELNRLLTVVAARWSGVPLPEAEIPKRTKELQAMVEQAARFGPRHWQARVLRRRCERWCADVIDRTRAGEIKPREGSQLALIAAHEENGAKLDREAAAVEIINVLRPLVAVSRFIAFEVLALHLHPHWREAFTRGDTKDERNFVQEVRRLYPFFPVIGGRVAKSFSWAGHDFPSGRWVLLDLYGTNHDERLWPDPDSFRPERFRDWNGDPYTLIPQGAGHHMEGHRCPGEDPTIAVMQAALGLLTRKMRYRVPPQDLGVRLNRIPALPEDGMIVSDVAAA